MNARLTFVHALSPLHAGIGQGAGVIDLPIAREKATNLPYLPGSSLKGALRTRAFHGDEKEVYTRIFGPDTPTGEENRASLAQFSDQRLLLFPVRSLAGTFAWVTSPFILRRLLRELQDAGIETTQFSIPTISSIEHCSLPNEQSALRWKGQKDTNIYLEDLDLVPQTDDSATAHWAEWLSQQLFEKKDVQWREEFLARFCVVHDDLFNFLVITATEVTARIRLKEDEKTVQQGGLWYEEALPAESILSGLVLATPDKKNLEQYSTQEIFKKLTNLANTTIQLGGKATVGRGLCRVQFSSQEQ